MIYPTEWIGGNRAGSLTDKHNHILARIILPHGTKDMDSKDHKMFKYTNDKEKEDAYAEGDKWLFKISDEFGLTKNKYRFLDKNTIEMKTSKESFIFDSFNLEKIKDYSISMKDGNITYRDGRSDLCLLNILFGTAHVNYLDNNKLNLKCSNIVDKNIVPFEYVCENKKYNINHHLLITKFLQTKYFPHVINILPFNCWTFGKFEKIGSIHKLEGKSHIIKITAISKNTKTEFVRHINTLQFDNEKDALFEADKIHYDMAYQLGTIKNMINIINNETMFVMLTQNFIMITDTEFLHLVNILSLFSETTANMCKPATRLDYTNKPFDNLITGYKNTVHINGNTLDNRLINLRPYSKNVDIKTHVSLQIVKKEQCCVIKSSSSLGELTKYLYLKDFNEDFEKIKKISEIFCDNICSINVNSPIVTFTELESKEDLEYLLKNLEATKNVILDNLILDRVNFMENFNIPKEAKYAILHKLLTIGFWRVNNIDAKIHIVKRKIKNKNPKKTCLCCLPYDTTHVILPYEKCQIEYYNFNGDNANTDETCVKPKPNKYHESKNDEYFEAFKQLVSEKGGTVISSEYLGAHVPLECVCQDGHAFACAPNNMQKGRWCPVCNINQSEFYMSQIVHYIFPDSDFRKTRPSWLKNSNGNNLELDLYSHKLSLAFEYNGLQHYEFIKYFHKTPEIFEKRRNDDITKKQLCDKNNVVLIVVPYTVESNDMYPFILSELKKHNVKFTEPTAKLEIKSIKFCNSQMELIMKIIKEKGGKFIDGVYVTGNSLITIECEDGHKWTTRMTKILSGSWCHTCGEIISDDRANKISQGVAKFNETDAGKELKKQSIIKRSETMFAKRQLLRDSITHKPCRYGDKCTNTAPKNEKGELPVSCFCAKKDAKDGFQSDCKECVKIAKRARKQNA